METIRIKPRKVLRDAKFSYLLEGQWTHEVRVAVVEDILQRMRFMAGAEAISRPAHWSPLNFICEYLDIDDDFEVSRDKLGVLNVLLGLKCSSNKKIEIVHRLLLRLEHEAMVMLSATSNENSKKWNVFVFLHGVMLYIIDELLGTPSNEDEE